MDELKPCPFCGNKASKTARFNMGYFGDGIKCTSCKAETPSYLVEQKAIDWWNTRADGWISVEDELPQEDFQVIACCDDDVEACIFRVHESGNYYFERVDGDFRLEATHWMPLPAPPKAVK
jgi:Lar family restriction alleviation protein